MQRIWAPAPELKYFQVAATEAGLRCSVVNADLMRLCARGDSVIASHTFVQLAVPCGHCSLDETRILSSIDVQEPV